MTQTDQPKELAVNVASTERWVSIGTGAVLTLIGLSRFRLGALLATAAGVMLVKRGLTGHCALYQSMGINTSRSFGDGAAPEEYFERGIHVQVRYTVQKPAHELYEFWHKFDNLPRFMHHLESVTCAGDRSHWVAKGPMGMTVQWDAQLINDEPDRLIAWRSLEGADVDNAGSVRFLDVHGGTEVVVTMEYIPPAGRAGSALASLFGKDAQQMIEQDLCRFKELMESSPAAVAAT